MHYGRLERPVARLPFGVPDPVICGVTAVELYTGGLWSSSNLEVLAVEARPLVAELFAVGFRWTERPLHPDTGLWHPSFAIGVDIIEGLEDLDWAARSNVLRMALDEFPANTTGVTREWLNVIGIVNLVLAPALHGSLAPRTRLSPWSKRGRFCHRNVLLVSVTTRALPG